MDDNAMDIAGNTNDSDVQVVESALGSPSMVSVPAAPVPVNPASVAPAPTISATVSLPSTSK